MNQFFDQNKWRRKLIPIKIDKNDSHKVIDLKIDKNHYALKKKLNVFLGDHHKKFICRRCLISYTSGNMLMLHKPKCESYDITTIRTAGESHIQWKTHFHKNPLYFRIYADFEAVNEISNSSIGNKTTNFFEQNPKLNGHHIVSELDEILQSNYYNSPLGYDHVDWFVNEIIKLGNKMALYFKITKKDIIMTEEDKECFKKIGVCRFLKKKLNLIMLEIIVT